jgi:pimeloyl-ACP methyl ester carboxylesterase
MAKTIILMGVAAAMSSAAGIAGSWQGSLVVPGGSLRVVFNITENPDKTLTATMDSPDQGAKGIPVDEVKLAGDSVVLKASSIGGSYAGKLVSDSAMDGTWTQSGGAFPLAMTRLVKPIEINRPQEPKPPYPYVVEEVSIQNASAGVTLAGTLTKPKGEGKFPAAVLITGSGPQNRDEEIFGHKPFLLLADYLTRKGIAVLRYDDRGVAKSLGDFAKATTRDFASDVEAAVAYLKTRKDIDLKQIGLIGHSEGAIIAPMVATEYPGIAFVVLMAAPGVTGEAILYRQGVLIAKAEGAPDSAIAEQDSLQHRIFAILKSHPDSAGSAVELTRLADELDSTARARGRADDTMLRLALQQQMKRVQSQWFRFFLTYDPKPALLKLVCPVLAIYGSKDLQVDPAQNMPVLEDAFKTSKHADWLVKELPGLNHLFQTANTGAVSEYAQIEETMAPAALELIGSWVSAHTLGK